MLYLVHTAIETVVTEERPRHRAGAVIMTVERCRSILTVNGDALALTVAEARLLAHSAPGVLMAGPLMPAMEFPVTALICWWRLPIAAELAWIGWYRVGPEALQDKE